MCWLPLHERERERGERKQCDSEKESYSEASLLQKCTPVNTQTHILHDDSIAYPQKNANHARSKKYLLTSVIFLWGCVHGVFGL
mmetsp:Transcript_17521/g.30523  ORF Transcript_17521/g.30523 Transcript_17521/m.30523 type:complete len:84 (+) Transcript_17521:688-939(+)